MPENLKIFSSVEFKSTVQDLRDLLSQQRLAFLMGAGCSAKAGLPLMVGLTEEVMNHDTLSKEAKKVLDAIRELFAGANAATVEDYMSELVDYLSITERRIQRGAKNSEIELGDSKLTSVKLTSVLDEVKQIITKILNEKDVDISYHQRFVRSIHSSLQAGKSSRSVNYYVLNYDTLLEDSLGLEKIPYVDGFAGAATGWWEPSVFQNAGVDARVFKIHGSIEWCLLEEDSLPRRVRQKIRSGARREHVLIYPAATKYMESQRDPFAQLLQQFRDGLRSSENEEIVLAICGYNFGDSHINIEIRNALYQSDGRLTVAVFISDDEPQGILREWVDDLSITEQIRVYANRIFLHANTTIRSDKDLPWWKFEVLAQLLGGER